METIPVSGWWRPVPPRRAIPEAAPTPARPAAAPGSRVPFQALMAFTIILIVAPQNFLPFLSPLRPALLSAGVAILACLFDRLSRGLPLFRLEPEMRLGVALGAWALITVPFSFWPTGSLQFLAEIFFKTLTIFWLLGSVVVTRRRLHQMTWCLVLLSVPLAAAAVHNYAAGYFISDGGRRILGYSAPLTANPNDLALMLNLLLPLGVALFMIHRRALTRLMLAGIILSGVLAIVLTFSRAGFLTMALLGLFTARKTLRRPAVALVVMLLALAALPLLPEGYVEQMKTIVNIQADPTGSASERWNDMVAASRALASRPVIGVGAGMNVLAMNETRGATWRVVHNAYLEQAIELGLPGLVLFLCLLAASVRATARVKRRLAGDPARADLFHLAEAIQLSLLAFAFAALFHPIGYHFYFYYFAGLAVALRVATRRETAGETR